MIAIWKGSMKYAKQLCPNQETGNDTRKMDFQSSRWNEQMLTFLTFLDEPKNQS